MIFQGHILIDLTFKLINFSNKKLISLNQAVKENIQTYLTQFRMMTTDELYFT